MHKMVALTLVLALGAGARLASATKCNIDLTNTGTVTAYDAAVVLPGTQTVSETYNGGPMDDVFHAGPLPPIVTGGNTTLHWSNPTSPYFPSSTVQGHIGYTPSSGKCDLVDFYWTGQNGQRLPGSQIPYVQVHVGGGLISFTNNSTFSVALTNVRGAQLTSSIPLSALNRGNTSLGQSLVSLGSDTNLPSGASIHFPWPWPPCLTCPPIAVFGLNSSFATGRVTFWVEQNGSQ